VSAFKALGLPEDSDPNVLIQPKEASLSAAVFWKVHGCNELLDKDMFSASVKVVNGAPPNDENKGKQRLANYRACVAYLKTINQ
jgi:predicted chitinase